MAGKCRIGLNMQLANFYSSVFNTHAGGNMRL